MSEYTNDFEGESKEKMIEYIYIATDGHKEIINRVKELFKCLFPDSLN